MKTPQTPIAAFGYAENDAEIAEALAAGRTVTIHGEPTEWTRGIRLASDGQLVEGDVEQGYAWFYSFDERN